MRQKRLGYLFVFFLLATAVLLLVSSMKYRQSLMADDWSLRPVHDLSYELEGGTSERITLPTSLKNLAPRTAVTLLAEIDTLPGESIYIKSVFAPLKLYLNDELFYEYGQIGTYPGFLNDPPTGIALLELPKEGGIFSLRAEYQSLTQRSTLALPAFYIGEHSALLNRLLQADGFSFLFSLLLIFLGLIMTVVALTFVRKIPSGKSFLWLGLFSLSTGIWVFGECNLTSRLLPYPALLYILDYLGMFFVAIPFLHFGLVMLSPQDERPIRIMLHVHYLSVATAILLQLSGKVDFIRSLFWFHIITPLAFVLFAVCLIWEGLKNKNPSAKLFAPATILLAFSTILELINYWLRLTNTFTIFFQLGVLFFIISLGIVSGYYIRESMNAAIDKEKLEYEMKNIEKQLSLQRLQYQRMSEDEEKLKKERHDFHHHLAALKSLSGDKEKLCNYLDHLAEKSLPDYDLLLCDNFAVNAVAAHYYTQAREEGINIIAKLAVPRELTAEVESDLCVVVGNLMENAVEACLSVPGRQRTFIRMNSSLDYNVLTITTDNSYSGTLRKQDGYFLSSKREGQGIGISSVAVIAEKYGGGARFEEKDGMFQASVYLKLAPR